MSNEIAFVLWMNNRKSLSTSDEWNQLQNDWINDCISAIIQCLSFLTRLSPFLIAKLIKKSLILFVLLHLEFMARCENCISSYIFFFGEKSLLNCEKQFTFKPIFLIISCHSLQFTAAGYLLRVGSVETFRRLLNLPRNWNESVEERVKFFLKHLKTFKKSFEFIFHSLLEIPLSGYLKR